MGFDPVHLSYRLTRRQQLSAHVQTWLSIWPGWILMVVVPALVVGLAVMKSLWFLLLLLVPPLTNNLPRFVAGFVQPLLWGSRSMDVFIDADRIGFLHGKDRHWLPLADVDRVDRGDDLWMISSSDARIDIPVAAIDEACLAHLRERSAAARLSRHLDGDDEKVQR